MQYLENNDKHMFMSDVLKMLHIKTDIFLNNLANHHDYEMVIYLWIDKLFTKGKTSEEAVQIIYKARNIFMLQAPCIPMSGGS